MTHSNAMKAIRQAATTAELSEIIDAYLETLGEDPADSASETLQETAARFYDAGNTDAHNVLMTAHDRWEELESEEAEQV
jgi:GTP cyclohydrolase I